MMVKRYFFTSTVALIALFATAQTRNDLMPDTSYRNSWYGFDRYDFLMDSIDFTIRPFHAAQKKEETGITELIPGKYRCIIVMPHKMAPGSPWSWRGCYWDHQPQTEVELLKRGFHIAFVMSEPGKAWDIWYQYLTKNYGLSNKPAFIGMSKGGVYEYSWATGNPEKVSCIYADNPALYPESMQKMNVLAKNDVPLLHVCGDFDFLLEQHTLILENLYHQMGGRISVMIKDGTAHHPHSLQDPSIIAGWIEHNVQPDKSYGPDFIGMKFVKSYYYSFENKYNFLPAENIYVTCRGPLFNPCYQRYDQQTSSNWGITGITVIIPGNPAAGNPWVLRADRIGREPSPYDLALLAKGFYIVAAPVTSQAGPLQKEWDSLYNLLTANGFSKKPVLEGTGTGAGEAYAWAVLNPSRVSTIFSVNPVLRSLQTKTAAIDNLNTLAHASISIIDICGALDPGLKENTLSVEQRYKQFGGKIKVIIHEQEGHFLSPSNDPETLVDFILQK
jgi:hypothetical protein